MFMYNLFSMIKTPRGHDAVHQHMIPWSRFFDVGEGEDIPNGKYPFIDFFKIVSVDVEAIDTEKIPASRSTFSSETKMVTKNTWGVTIVAEEVGDKVGKRRLSMVWKLTKTKTAGNGLLFNRRKEFKSLLRRMKMLALRSNCYDLEYCMSEIERGPGKRLRVLPSIMTFFEVDSIHDLVGCAFKVFCLDYKTTNTGKAGIGILRNVSKPDTILIPDYYCVETIEE